MTQSNYVMDEIDILRRRGGIISLHHSFPSSPRRARSNKTPDAMHGAAMDMNTLKNDP